MRKIILASASPGRRQLLEKLGLKFEVEPSNSMEKADSALEPAKLAINRSMQKARLVARNYPDAIIIAADTIGVLGNIILGKPRNRLEARRMLETVSGKSHLVITGFTILDSASGKSLVRSEQTTVYVKNLSRKEIEAYVRTGEPLDKAGAYAIQGIGSVLIERIEGDFYNVIGLPLSSLAYGLKEFGIDVMQNFAKREN